MTEMTEMTEYVTQVLTCNFKFCFVTFSNLAKICNNNAYFCKIIAKLLHVFKI